MKYFIFIICLLFSFSCVSQKKVVITKSAIKFEGKNTNIRNLINIDGFYSNVDSLRYASYMFFEDGTWVQFHFKSDIAENDREKNMVKSIKSWVNKKQLRWGVFWGVYKIKNDTIVAHSYDEPAFLVPLSLSKMRYKIINKNTIKLIYFRSKSKEDDKYYSQSMESPWREGSPLHFTPADSLPSSDNWLKENKWIWRNESDWKNYMQHVEQIKKQYKKK